MWSPAGYVCVEFRLNILLLRPPAKQPRIINLSLCNSKRSPGHPLSLATIMTPKHNKTEDVTIYQYSRVVGGHQGKAGTFSVCVFPIPCILWYFCLSPYYQLLGYSWLKVSMVSPSTIRLCSVFLPNHSFLF